MDSPDLPATAGDLLRALRHRLGVSQRALAESLGVAASTIARAESEDERLDRWHLLDRAATAAGLRLAAINDDGAPLPSAPFPEARNRGGQRFPAHAVVRPATHSDQARDRWVCWFGTPEIVWSFDHPNFRNGWATRRANRASRTNARQQPRSWI